MSFHQYKFREREFIKYFEQHGDLVYGSDVPGLDQMFGIQYRFPFSLQREVSRLSSYRTFCKPPRKFEIGAKQNYIFCVCADLKVLDMLLSLQQENTKMFY